MHYRLYGLNEVTGRIMQGRDIAAETDEQAIAQGHAVHAGTPFEIWCQSRLVFSSTASASGADARVAQTSRTG